MYLLRLDMRFQKLSLVAYFDVLIGNCFLFLGCEYKKSLEISIFKQE